MRVIGVLILAALLVLVLDFALAPYTYYYGGHFHVIPGWQGQGRIHAAASGGDYFLYLYIEPSTPGYQKSDIHVRAYLCTPNGERFRLSGTGDWPRERPTSTIGVPVHLSLHQAVPLLPWHTNNGRPRLELYGAFADRKLELEERGSLASEFRPDGTLYPPHQGRARGKESIHFTLDETNSWISPGCPAR